jgi:hypothetical protein
MHGTSSRLLHRSLIVGLSLLSVLYGTFSPAGDRWYKGNTHAHSFWSDGDEFPEMVADWYKSHGYDFLAISDHDCLMEGEKWAPVDRGDRCIPSSTVEKCQNRFGADWLVLRSQGGNRQVKLKTFDEVCGKVGDPGRFLLMQAEEISAKFLDCHVHVNAINLSKAVSPKKGLSVADTLARNLNAIRQEHEPLKGPFLAHVNHPNWSDYDITPEDLAGASAARFVEVCNAGPGSRHYGDATHPNVEELWDIASNIRIAKMKAPPLYGIGADDAHHYHAFSPEQANPGRAWVMVRAKDLTAEALLGAMYRGDFYVSTGVTLREVAYDPKQQVLKVEVQAEPVVQYTIEFVGTLEGVDPTGQPAAADKNAKTARPGRTYSAEVGKVLESVQGAAATYKFTGKELYVRAVVHSNKPIRNAPAGEMQKQEAWCQPVGWEKQVFRHRPTQINPLSVNWPMR